MDQIINFLSQPIPLGFFLFFFVADWLWKVGVDRVLDRLTKESANPN